MQKLATASGLNLYIQFIQKYTSISLYYVQRILLKPRALERAKRQEKREAGTGLKERRREMRGRGETLFLFLSSYSPFKVLGFPGGTACNFCNKPLIQTECFVQNGDWSCFSETYVGPSSHSRLRHHSCRMATGWRQTELTRRTDFAASSIYNNQ